MWVGGLFDLYGRIGINISLYVSMIISVIITLGTSPSQMKLDGNWTSFLIIGILLNVCVSYDYVHVFKRAPTQVKMVHKSQAVFD